MVSVQAWLLKVIDMSEQQKQEWENEECDLLKRELNLAIWQVGFLNGKINTLTYQNGKSQMAMLYC